MDTPEMECGPRCVARVVYHRQLPLVPRTKAVTQPSHHCCLLPDVCCWYQGAWTPLDGISQCLEYLRLCEACGEPNPMRMVKGHVFCFVGSWLNEYTDLRDRVNTPRSTLQARYGLTSGFDLIVRGCVGCSTDCGVRLGCAAWSRHQCPAVTRMLGMGGGV
jgi:hypothetical protein